MDSAEEVLLNVNEMAEGYSYYHVEDFTVSPDNNLIAYGVDTISRRKYTIKLPGPTITKLFSIRLKMKKRSAPIK